MSFAGLIVLIICIIAGLGVAIGVYWEMEEFIPAFFMFFAGFIITFLVCLIGYALLFPNSIS